MISCFATFVSTSLSTTRIQLLDRLCFVHTHTTAHVHVAVYTSSTDGLGDKDGDASLDPLEFVLDKHFSFCKITTTGVW